MKKDPENVFTGCSSDRECVLYIENVNAFCAQAIQARFDDRDATTAATSCFLCASMPVCASMCQYATSSMCQYATSIPDIWPPSLSPRGPQYQGTFPDDIEHF